MSPVVFRRKAIRSEQTLGERLISLRESQKLTLTDVESATHVRAKHLEALEQSQYDILPEEVYTLGFIRRYAHFLGIDADEAITQHRSERLAAQKRGWSKPNSSLGHIAAVTTIAEPRMVITPKFFWLTTSLVVVFGIVGYIWYQVHGFMGAPDLQLAQATPEMVVSTPSIEIKGQTEGSAFVTINAEPVAINSDGSFAQEVRLEPGMNTIEIAARNRLNKETRKHLKVLATYQ